MTAKHIIESIERYYQLEPGSIASRTNAHHIARPRHLAAYLIREKLALSFPEIARWMGGKHHTTIIHGCRYVLRHMSEYAAAIAWFEEGAPKTEIEHLRVLREHTVVTPAQILEREAQKFRVENFSFMVGPRGMLMVTPAHLDHIAVGFYNHMALETA